MCLVSHIAWKGNKSEGLTAIGIVSAKTNWALNIRKTIIFIYNRRLRKLNCSSTVDTAAFATVLHFDTLAATMSELSTFQMHTTVTANIALDALAYIFEPVYGHLPL